MIRTRDRLVAAGAVAIVVALSGLVVRTVLEAQARGREALRRNQESSIEQLAAGMDQRLESTLTSIGGIATGPYALVPGSAEDQARLDQLQALNTRARSGMLLLDARGTITAGTLLSHPSDVGTVLERPGLEAALTGGRAVILPAAPGITTELPTIAIFVPIFDAAGDVEGGFIFEAVVAIDSDLSKEIAELRQGRTGVFTFVDELGTVIVSTDGGQLGRPLDVSLRSGPVGLQRMGSLVVGRADVPSAGWRLIFTQDLEEFEAGLGRRVQTALLLLFVVTLIGAGLAFASVVRRLRAERIERARMQEINETREEFISIVSHELRTPVAGIAGFLDSTLDHWHLMDDTAKHHAVTRARANARRLEALTRDVLDTSAAESGELSYLFDVIDLSAEVEATVEAARDQHRGREIILRPCPASTWVRADPDRIQQVLINLIDNGIKNSPPDSPIEIDVSTDPANVIVAVRDHGPGISIEERGRLFEKWVRGRTSVQGTGLGLYVARMIVEAHHGELHADEADGGGEVFTFSVPLSIASDNVSV